MLNAIPIDFIRPEVFALAAIIHGIERQKRVELQQSVISLEFKRNADCKGLVSNLNLVKHTLTLLKNEELICEITIKGE
jgi:hypothetical protein